MLCTSAFSDDASMFRGNPAHTGVYNGTAITASPQVKWKFHSEGRIISSPAVMQNLVYVGSTDGKMYALDRESGVTKWKFETKARITSSPAVGEGVVYFGSYDGNFYDVDVLTGQLKWRFQTGGERRFAGKHLHGIQPVDETMPDPFDFYLSSPAIWNGAVYFGSGDGNIYALDAKTGALKWKFTTGNVVHASPAIADGTLFLGSWDSYFYALDATTGKEKWRFKTGEDHDIHNQVGIQSSAAVMDGTVFFGCRDSNFYALDAKTGEKKWVFNNKGSWVITSPAVKDGKVYFATSDSATFYELDAKTGAVVFSLKFKQWPFFSSPAIVDDMLYIGSHEGKLIAIDLRAQKPAWDFATDGSRQNGVALTKPDGSPNYDLAFTEDFYDNLVVGVDKMLAVGTILSSPVVADRVIYLGSTDGNLYALQ
jgi:eukaryotic-like serine/threonine-protein kinase